MYFWISVRIYAATDTTRDRSTTAIRKESRSETGETRPISTGWRNSSCSANSKISGNGPEAEERTIGVRSQTEVQETRVSGTVEIFSKNHSFKRLFLSFRNQYVYSFFQWALAFSSPQRIYVSSHAVLGLNR